MKNNKTTKNIKQNGLKSGYVLENNHQVENAKFISIAGKTVENVWDFHSLNGQNKLEKKRVENTMNDIAEKLE